MKKRLTGILLAFAMALSLLPWSAAPARAEDDAPEEQGFRLGMDAVEKDDMVWLGNFNDEQSASASSGTRIPWRVLSPVGEKLLSVSGKEQVLLISNYLLGKHRFDDDSNEWAGSEAQKWCADLYDNWSAAAEKAAIVATTATGGGINGNYTEPGLNAEHFFFLTKEEVVRTLGTSGGAAAGYFNTGYRNLWWLRSAYPYKEPYGKYAAVIDENGGLDICSVDWDQFFVRPAFNLDPARVLLATAARGGKPDADGVLASMPENASSDWKLTLLDDGRSGFLVTTAPARVEVGGTVRVGYSGAQTGDNEYVSALLLNADGAALGYGSVPAASGKGTATFTLPDGLTPGDYTLKVFSEQRGGNYESDYASIPVELPLAVAKETVYGGFIADGGVAFNCKCDNFVDDDVNTKWYASRNEATTPPGESEACVWVDFHAENAITVNQYSLVTGDDTTKYPQRNPRAWTLKAKRNPGDEWTTIAAVTDDHTLEAKDKKIYTFPLERTGTWQYFRFMAGGGSEFYGFQFQELMLEYDVSADKIASATVGGVRDRYPYTGGVIDVAYTVTTADGTVLREGTDYDAAISPSPVQTVGDYTLTVTGIGSYSGSQSVTFSVLAPAAEAEDFKNGDTVWFGAKVENETAAPIAWRVLSAVGDETLPVSDAKHALLISKYILGVTFFDSNYHDGINNVWAGSTAQVWCTSFYTNWAAKAEKAAIAATSAAETNDKDNGDTPYFYQGGRANDCYGAAPLDGERFFFLSAQEADTYFANDADRMAYHEGASNASWWIRSPFAANTRNGGIVTETGWVFTGDVFSDAGARPAFNLDLNTVLFASAAAGDKPGADAVLAPLPANETHEWKLTLLDDSRTGFTVTETSVTAEAGSAFSLSYSGAKTGENECVSVLLYDTRSAPIGYGGSAPLNSASGTVRFTLPMDLAPGRYTLKVFNEQRNGDYMSDYASIPVEFALVVTPVRAEVSGDFTTGTLRATVAAPAGALLIAAGYDGAGRLADTAAFTVEEGKTLYDAEWTRQSGYTYKLMLVDPDTFAPLCAAWDSSKES